MQPQNTTPNEQPIQSIKTFDKGTKLLIIGAVFILLSAFGIIQIITVALAQLLLGNPSDNTTGRAIVNISALSVSALCIIVGISLAIIGTIRQIKYSKATKTNAQP